jgi:argininosuccinate lyase
MDKMWDGRFTKGTASEVEAFTASIFFDCQLADMDVLGSLAHVSMLQHVGILTSNEAQEIKRGLIQIKENLSAGKIVFSPSDEDIHMKIESELKALIGPVAGKMHTARSRNDQVALDMHLYLRSKTLTAIELIEDLVRKLLEKAKENLHVIMPGYTHLQRAQPILFSQHLLAYVSMFRRDMERLMDGWSRINRLPLGACALAGTGFPIDPKYVADLLKFDALYENSVDAVSDRDFCIEFLASLSLIMTHLSRFSEELVLWCSQEFAFIELDDAYSTGSSIMPQKKNPDVPELVRGKTGRVYGSLMAMLTTLKGLPLAYNKDMQEDKEAIFDAVKTMNSCLSVYKGLIETLQVNESSMLQATETGFLNATELADALASKGASFREAHSIVGKIVRHCLDSCQKLEDLSLEQFQAFSPLITKEMIGLLDLKKIVSTKNSPGGTSPAQVEKQLAIHYSGLEKTHSWVLEKQKELLKAEETLLSN